MADTKTLREVEALKQYLKECDDCQIVQDVGGSWAAAWKAALAAQSQADPYGWAVTGGLRLYFGEFAEHEAKEWAQIFGGTAEAFPLHRHAHAQGEPPTRVQDAATGLLDALTELADLVDHMRAGNYVPDSFTTQPARAAIAKEKARRAKPVVVPDDVTGDAARWRYAMDWGTTEFAVCKRVGATGACWEPIKTSGPLDRAMLAAAKGGAL